MLKYNLKTNGNRVNSLAKDVGERIRELRTNRGWLQAELAKKMGITNQMISNWERSYTKIIDAKDVAKLAEVFEVSTDYILLGVTPTQKIQEALADEPELLEFFNDLTTREELQILFKQVKPLKRDTIKRIIKYIKIVEDEESNE